MSARFLVIVLGGLAFFFNAKSPSFASSNLSLEARKIEEKMQILYLIDSMKSPYDTIEVAQNSAKIRVWRDLPPNPRAERLECLGYQWLLSGRGEKMGEGAVEVFEAFPNLERISLELVDIEFDVEGANKRGLLKKIAKPTVYLNYEVSRQELSKYRTNSKVLKANLYKDQESCLSIGRKLNMKREIPL